MLDAKPSEHRDFIWRTSSRSNQQGECVEVAGNLPGVVAVRDSKNPLGGHQAVQPAAWAAFVRAVKRGAL
jgi:hypothetical protein